MTPEQIEHRRRAPVFFSDKVIAAIDGLTDEQALIKIAEMIADAQFAKQEGSGPSQDEINQARRLYLNTFERIYGSAPNGYRA